MTPILRRGDRVHLAVPLKTTDIQAFNRTYASQGVTVVHTSVVSGLDRPVVIAIFRDGD